MEADTYSPSAKATHYLVVTYPSWAHVRSELGLSLSLLHLNPDLHITVLVPAKRAAAAAIEIAQYPPVTPPERLRTVAYGQDPQAKREEGGVGGMWNPKGGFRDECMRDLEGWDVKLAKGGTVVDSITGEPFMPLPTRFSAIISDVTLGAFGKMVQAAIARETGQEGPPALCFGPYNTAFVAFMFLSEYNDLGRRIERVVQESGGDQEKMVELAQRHLGESGDLVRLPGLHPFYQYEAYPVEKESMADRITTLAGLHKVLPLWCDGLIVGWPAGMGGKEMQGAMDRAFGKSYQVGFQLPPAVLDEWAAERRLGECKDYLDRKLNESGEKSVLYISFGSAIYAPVYPQMVVLLDVLAKLDLPYIMAEGNAPDDIRDLMRKRVGIEDRGLLVTWAPQRAVLSHPATGMFLCHGGSNSAMEAMLFQVPMALWPAGFDQPFICNELDNLGVGAEILQMRTGPSIRRPVARNGHIVHGTDEALAEDLMKVIGDMKGAHVDKMRARLREMSGLIREDRLRGKSAEQVMELAFLGS